MSQSLKLLLLAIATLMMGAFAVSNQSFWIDEGVAAMKALQPTLGDWWQALRVDGDSNLQLLPHLFYLWGWDKIFGSSEISLRAANLPLLFVGLAAALWALQRQPKLQFWFCLLALVNAFTWDYTSEARPYILLFAASCIALGALIRMIDAPESGRLGVVYAVFCFGLLLVSATSLIAVPWAAAWFASALVLLGFSTFVSLIRRNIVTTLCFLAAMSVLAAYYWWTLKLGARASAIGTTSFSNLLLVLYEQLGLTGLGPGRSELRITGVNGLRPYAFPLSLGLLASAFVFWQALRSLPARWWTSRQAVAALLGIVLPLGLVLLAGHAAHVRILGRHLTPLFPIVLFVLALGFKRMQEVKSRAHWLALAIVPLVFLTSALQVRFAARHARDDYRGAAALALRTANAGGTVWWMADQSTGLYYGLPLGQTSDAPRAGAVVTPDLGEIARQPRAGDGRPFEGRRIRSREGDRALRRGTRACADARATILPHLRKTENSAPLNRARKVLLRVTSPDLR